MRTTEIQLQPRDILRLKAPTGTRYNVWRVTGVHYGALGQESLVTLQSITSEPGEAVGYKTCGESVVPLVMVESISGLTIIRPGLLERLLTEQEPKKKEPKNERFDEPSHRQLTTSDQLGPNPGSTTRQG